MNVIYTCSRTSGKAPDTVPFLFGNKEMLEYKEYNCFLYPNIHLK